MATRGEKSAPNALGRCIRARAQVLGITLAELARRTGMSRQTLYDIGEVGGRLPEIATVLKLALELGVHPMQLLQSVFEDYQFPPKVSRQHRDHGDKSLFVSDVSIPDGTVVAPGARFTKTWELQNVGTQPWTGRTLRCMDDELVIGRRDKREAPVRLAERLQPLVNELPVPLTPPGGIVRLSVDFVAPTSPGTCVSYWKSFFADGRACFPQSLGLSCKVRVLSFQPAVEPA